MLGKLLKNIKRRIINRTMYPEIKKAGGLGNAINLEFEKIGSAQRVSTDNDLDKFPVVCEIVEKGRKFSQIYIAAEKNYTYPTFGKKVFALRMRRRTI